MTIRPKLPLPAGAFAIVAEMQSKPGREDALRAATLPLVAPARSEATTLLFLLHEDREIPGHLVLYEIYASAADHRAHVAKPHVQAWFGQLTDLTESGLRVIHMAMLDPQAGGFPDDRRPAHRSEV